MSDIKDVTRSEANKKIKDLAEEVDICFFTTQLDQLPLATRPMSTQKVDDDGTLWFFSNADSDKNEHIQEDDRVQLFYAGKSSNEYLSIYGTATIVRDTKKAKELWGPLLKTWFPGGPEDPNLTLLKVVPEDGYYWDTKNNKLVSLIKIAAGALTGKEMDDSIEGRIRP